MSKGLIEKSEILDNIHILIPNDLIDNDKLILISHGSGGIGAAEYCTAKYFLSKGYRVGLIDYFSKYDIKKLWWWYHEKHQDSNNISFFSMLTNIKLPKKYKIIHIGFSLGGFFGILNSHKFYRNYCFYPGIVGFTNELTNKNYSNTTIFVASKDEWCDYTVFESFCKLPARRIDINAYHGFMIPNKNTEIDIAKYHLPSVPISKAEFYNLKPCHKFLEATYGYDPKTIRLQYDKKYCKICLKMIGNEIE